MVLIDRDHLLPALREQCKAEQKELSLIHIYVPQRRSRNIWNPWMG